jgi:hypothetical protein
MINKSRDLALGLIVLHLSVMLFITTSCSGPRDDRYYPDDWYSWNSLGSPGKGEHTGFAIAVDTSDNKPVVVFRDSENGTRPHVFKWSSGTSWTNLGFLTSSNGDQPSIIMDLSDNKPLVVFQDNVNSAKVRVLKWSSGTSWTDLGFVSSGASQDYYRVPSIRMDPSDNKAVVVFVDASTGDKVQVKKWSSGTSWTDLGYASTGAGYFCSLALDPSDNKPVVAFIDMANGEKPHAKKWSAGTSWTDLGYPSIGASSAAAMAISASDSKPVVAFIDDPTGATKVHVTKWSIGTSWIDLGYPSQRSSDSPSLVIDPSDNKPIIAFRDWAVPPDLPEADIHVKKWSSGTSWTGLGWPVAGPSSGTSIAIDPSDGKPFAMYTDPTDGRIYVAKMP